MGSNITSFINAKNTDPRLIINPDSMKARDMVTFAFEYNAIWEFRTLDGKKRNCRTYNYNDSTKVYLWINDTNYKIDPVEDYPLFTFDSRIILDNKGIFDYSYIYYEHEDIDSESMTLNGNPANNPFSCDLYYAFSYDGVMKSYLDTYGFNVGSAPSFTDSFKTIQWKFRSRIKKEDYMSIALFQGNKYSSISDSPLTYYSRTLINGLSGMHRFISKCFPEYSWNI